MKPGATIWPEASSSCVPRNPGPTAEILPPVTATSALRRGPPVPSTSVPPLITMSPSIGSLPR